MLKFRGEPIEGKEYRTRISEVHFLVHPGFVVAMRTAAAMVAVKEIVTMVHAIAVIKRKK